MDVCALANGSEVSATTLAAKIRAAAFMTARWVMLCFAAPGMATSDNKVRAALAQPAAFQTLLAALRKREWVVYAKRPFGGPEAVLAYLSRYTHRTAIANRRLFAFAGERVTFKWKDYRAKGDARYKLMTLGAMSSSAAS